MDLIMALVYTEKIYSHSHNLYNYQNLFKNPPNVAICIDQAETLSNFFERSAYIPLAILVRSDHMSDHCSNKTPSYQEILQRYFVN